MRLSNISDFRKAMRVGRYSWPGGYENFFTCDDGGVICEPCARREARLVLDSIHSEVNDGWRVTRFECSANYDGPLECEHCGKWIIEPDNA